MIQCFLAQTRSARRILLCTSAVMTFVLTRGADGWRIAAHPEYAADTVNRKR